MNITVSVLSVLLILAGTAALYANSLLSRYSYVEEEPGVSKTPIGSVNTPTEELPDPEKVDGLYHDDMVTNILLLGVDDIPGAVKAITEAVEMGRLTEQRIDESVLRVLDLKLEHGIIG